ncbi:kinase IolC [Hyphomonas neptunium ATCC 15444]|uniref:Kinase IolC n=2 Tax=Hyphomonas TaxID=85 RepID=Q0C065_HYPNA|nr:MULTISPECIES: 5-dehydro-2-deoxygluconokinase [Hyphomonas]ABI75974.1 kinase IolC [Hyphomonas neptunium ATCC 15444]KCZ90539.1 kinase IolC [Hyphomonas hirschiana VP5]
MTDLRRTLDVITIGRAGVDLYGQQVGGNLEDVHSFAKYLGGCPANIAVGASRLGLRSGIITRVGSDHMGRFLQTEFQREGVNTDGIVTDKERLTALVILGIQDEDTFPLIFYRENCADMALCEADIDTSFIAQSRSILITGTHLSTEQTRATSRAAITAAKASNCSIILDIDYRPVLWGLTSRELGEERFVSDAKVTATLQEFIPACDLIVGTEEELHILGGTTDTIAAMHAIRALSDAVIVCKRGALGCSVFPETIPQTLDQGISGQSFKVEVFNVLGAGDAFMSGFLSGWLHDKPLEECCRLGNACGAIVVSRHGCAPAIPTAEELAWFLENGSPHLALRKDAALEHIHWTTTRSPRERDLAVFAIDHRSQLEAISREAAAPLEKISEFKSLALSALQMMDVSDVDLGILLDGRYGSRALATASGLPIWVGRAVELPGSRPLDFDSQSTVTGEMLEWPRSQVAKCLCFYHPDDPSEIKNIQERRIQEAFKASRETQREFLLEIICSQNGALADTTVSSAMRRIYELGVFPDWWKLEATASAQSWVETSRVIDEMDPRCRGILLLGLAAPAEDVVACFKVAAAFPLIKGFAVGRTIFQEPARQWFKGEIDDGEAVFALRRNFSQLIDGWRQSRQAP